MKEWCDQCQARRLPAEARACQSPFCRLKRGLGGMFANRTGSHQGTAHRAKARPKLPPAPRPKRTPKPARKRGEGLIDRLAEALCEDFVHPDDALALGLPANPGGDLKAAAIKIGISYSYANGLFQRMKARLGPLAR